MYVKYISISHSSIRAYIALFLFVVLSFVHSSCEPTFDGPVKKTLFMYYPWSTNLYSYFLTNIDEMQKCLDREIDDDYRVVVYIASSSTKAEMYEIFPNRKPQAIAEYNIPTQISAPYLAKLITDAKAHAPAISYSMTVSAHGTGWMFTNNQSSGISPLLKHRVSDQYGPLTRFFGGATPNTQMNISELRDAIQASNTHFDCILVDACYMANVEVAYELRGVCDYFVASAAEIMAYGMPYRQIGKSLMEGDYQQVCENFHSFYSSYSTPCGTISAVRSDKLDALASAMKSINDDNEISEDKLSQIQTLDGYSPSIFFDFQSYISLLTSSEDSNAVLSVLCDAVPYKAATPTFYTAIKKRQIDIDTYSGLTISDPSNNVLAKQKEQTEWYKATH